MHFIEYIFRKQRDRDRIKKRESERPGTTKKAINKDIEREKYYKVRYI